ncbi:MAG TPA: hypothetical protein VJV39_27365 [Dongiaceae bacterium]|nr:hypothetical protein [Dongiaceae bacterium]
MGEQEGSRAAATTGAGARRTKRWPRPIRRLLRVLRGRKKRRRRSKPRSADDRAIAWLWDHLAASTSRRYPPLYENRDAMILQMGRVASISIHQALRHAYNAYHSHGVSPARCTGMLQRLQLDGSGPDSERVMRGCLATLAHGALLQWYKRHKTRNGARLKIITLTRDPATWMSSHLVHRSYATLPQIRAWYVATAGRDPDRAVDELEAVRAFGAAFGEMILAARPSHGLSPAITALQRFAETRYPSAPGFIEVARSALSCGSWFDREIAPVLELDLLADGRLRDGGTLRTETDYAELLVVRFEDLGRSMPTFRDFLGLPDFALPHNNATVSERRDMRAAFEAGIEQAGGAAVRRELRATAYSRACGYDRLTD